MARVESQAIGGYFKTPTHLLPLIAGLLTASDGPERSALDPCAGEGEALQQVAKHVFGSKATLHAIELEEERYQELSRKRYGSEPRVKEMLHGDAFRVKMELGEYYGTKKRGVQLLYLNPPYDLDKAYKRLEERFLVRFTEVLSDKGVLVFVVPIHALAASALTLALHYENLHCFKFPSTDFQFQQCVLIATKTKRLSPDQAVIQLVQAWSANPKLIPVLREGIKPIATVPSVGEQETGFKTFELLTLDVMGLLSKVKPWHQSDRAGRLTPITGILPTSDELIARSYPVAMPPRPAHIAAGIAAGIFNGHKVSTNKGFLGPDLLVKGVFDREFITVEEKTNKDGEITGEVQVQQPKLVVTVLDLSTHKYHTVKSSAESSGTAVISEMTTGDLLTRYGEDLMRVMLNQCPVQHDPANPAHQFELGQVARPLYRAQAQAAMAAVRLLGGPKASRRARHGKAAFVQGEIGSGKTSVALAVSETIDARCTLVMCPPHLLDGWKEQIQAVVPWTNVHVLKEIADVELFAADKSVRVIGIVSREMAKLGHGWSPAGETCPKCGASIPSDVDTVKQRYHCQARYWEPQDEAARLAVSVARSLLPVAAKSSTVQQFFQSAHGLKMVAHFSEKPAKSFNKASLKDTASALLSKIKHDEAARKTLILVLAALLDDNVTAACAKAFMSIESYSTAEWAQRALVLMQDKELRNDTVKSIVEGFKKGDSYYYSNASSWSRWSEIAAKVDRQEAPGWPFEGFEFEDNRLCIEKRPVGSVKIATKALASLAEIAKWQRSFECEEPLFQATGPYRFPLANWIAKRYPDLVDLLILDEGHEYSNSDSAQSFAAHRLTGLGIPTLLLTGSVMNGYAESLFTNQWALDPTFRQEFNRDQKAEFVKRYGYRKQIVENKDEKGKVIAFGSQSDRVQRSVRTVGNAPGVLPLFLLRHLLRVSVTLHKSDLSIDIPPREDIVDRIQPSAEQKKRYESLKSTLITKIRADMFSPLAGRLWGQLAELPSYLDRAVMGNCEDRSWEIAYPQSVGGHVVARAEPMDSDTTLPKEQWLIDRVNAEIKEGRNVMVLCWHVELLPRISKLLKAKTGLEAPVLDAQKVAAGKRQAWIDKEILGKKRRILVVNPVAIQTGLNNLVWFSTQIWMENPTCNAIVFRQASGRIDRIGQTKPTRVIFPVYSGTMQEQMHKLLLHKVGVSQATDGLDAESALQAAGVGESDGFSSLSIGKQLYAMIEARVTPFKTRPMTAEVL